MQQPLTGPRTPLLAASSLGARTLPSWATTPTHPPSTPRTPQSTRTGGQPDLCPTYPPGPSISGPHIPRNPALRGVRKLTCGHVPLAEARQGQTTTPRGSHRGEAAERGGQAQTGTCGGGGQQDLGSEGARSFRTDYVPAPRVVPSRPIPQLRAPRSLSLGLLPAHPEERAPGTPSWLPG